MLEFLLLSSAGLVVFHFAIYPLIVCVLARHRSSRTERVEQRGHGRTTARERDPVGRALEHRDAALERLPGRVVGPGVFEALVYAWHLLRERARQHDRGHPRAAHRIGLLARVNGQGVEVIALHH